MTVDRRIVRCAIYTRKSSEEGLEQDFNSLDAQFEACGAYVTSQKHEGWKAQPTRYDDGGYSGGTLERPALKRLLADIEAGRIDMVVVYKIDRLTRSLLDFGKLVELLEKAQCSFVSVTQSFNTSTSMGRLTLNMLLSFAQFEREVTGERIRDKIAASKKKGMWMGGVPPLGYQSKERQLILESNEAAVVRHVFDFYREHRCIVRAKLAADQLGLRGRPSAKYPDGPSFTRGGIYWLLTNPIYAGRIRHKEQTFPGQHQPLIDPAAWDEIQATLISQPGGRARGRRNACHPSPLAGRIVDETGERLTPSHAASGDGRRRYYVSKCLIEKGGELASSGWRLPAVHVEQTVVSIVMDHLGAAAVATRIIDGQPGVKVISDLDRRLKAFAVTLNPAAALALVEQVKIAQGQIDIKLGGPAIANALNLQPEIVASAFLRNRPV
ncbi:MAG: recombinase family protein [Hyphomonadaceae bacterium]|nr:recombinase family protein [Hyphomonadaceae bacterium]